MRLQKVGSFDAPVYVTAPPGRQVRALRRRAGRQGPRRARAARRSRTPFLDVSDKVTHRQRAGPAVDRLRARLRVERAVLRLLHRRQRRHAGRRVPARAAADVADAGLRPRRCSRRTSPSPTTTAGCCCSAPTSCSTSASATVAAGATSTARAATRSRSARCSARSCASTRAPTARRPYSVPSDNPFVRPRGRARRDLQLRPAQPVAVLVRPHDRRPDDRRRRPGRGRGDRLRAQGQGPRGELRLARRSRATHRYAPGETAPGRDQAGDHARRTPTATARSPAAS